VLAVTFIWRGKEEKRRERRVSPGLQPFLLFRGGGRVGRWREKSTRIGRYIGLSLIPAMTGGRRGGGGGGGGDRVL